MLDMEKEHRGLGRWFSTRGRRDRGTGCPEIGPAISMRFPPDLLGQIDALARERDMSRAEFIERPLPKRKAE